MKSRPERSAFLRFGHIFRSFEHPMGNKEGIK